MFTRLIHRGAGIVAGVVFAALSVETPAIAAPPAGPLNNILLTSHDLPPNWGERLPESNMILQRVYDALRRYGNVHVAPAGCNFNDTDRLFQQGTLQGSAGVVFHNNNSNSTFGEFLNACDTRMASAAADQIYAQVPTNLNTSFDGTLRDHGHFSGSLHINNIAPPAHVTADRLYAYSFKGTYDSYQGHRHLEGKVYIASVRDLWIAVGEASPNGRIPELDGAFIKQINKIKAAH